MYNGIKCKIKDRIFGMIFSLSTISLENQINNTLISGFYFKEEGYINYQKVQEDVTHEHLRIVSCNTSVNL